MCVCVFVCLFAVLQVSALYPVSAVLEVHFAVISAVFDGIFMCFLVYLNVVCCDICCN